MLADLDLRQIAHPDRAAGEEGDDQRIAISDLVGRDIGVAPARRSSSASAPWNTCSAGRIFRVRVGIPSAQTSRRLVRSFSQRQSCSGCIFRSTHLSPMTAEATVREESVSMSTCA